MKIIINNIILMEIFSILSIILIAILYSSYFFYKNSSRTLLVTSLSINIFLFQIVISFFGLLDYNSTYNLQITHFNLFDNLIINITRQLLWENISFGIDVLSNIFALITILLISIALIIGSNARVYGTMKFFIILVQIIELMLLITFYTTDLFIFYLGFEGLTIPTFFLIFIYGAEVTKLRAAKFFLIYSFISSTLLSFAISLMYIQYQTTNLNQLLHIFLNDNSLTAERYIIIYLFLILGFGIKIPIVPFHMWLPEAHAEASTAGSIILAGLILKLGGYGILRFVLPLFSSFTIMYPYIQTTSILGILICSLSYFRTTNLKQIIAYTSIIHMNIITLSLFSQHVLTITGGILSMVSHSLISSSLFICAGILYNRFGTYEIQHFSGLNQTMPIFATFFIVLNLSNISLPLTFSFIGEFMILIDLIKTNIYMFVIVLVLITLNTLYSLWILNRIVYSDLIVINKNIKQLTQIQDIDLDEIYILSLFLIFIIWLGIAPNNLLNLLVQYYN